MHQYVQIREREIGDGPIQDKIWPRLLAKP